MGLWQKYTEYFGLSKDQRDAQKTEKAAIEAQALIKNAGGSVAAAYDAYFTQLVEKYPAAGTSTTDSKEDSPKKKLLQPSLLQQLFTNTGKDYATLKALEKALEIEILKKQRQNVVNPFLRELSITHSYMSHTSSEGKKLSIKESVKQANVEISEVEAFKKEVMTLPFDTILTTLSEKQKTCDDEKEKTILQKGCDAIASVMDNIASALGWEDIRKIFTPNTMDDFNSAMKRLDKELPELEAKINALTEKIPPLPQNNQRPHR
jgi:hypothetical protein